MSRLKEALETGKFGVTAEMAPPKGYDFTEQLEAGKLLAPKVHAVNVTDMQSASLKASSLGLCIALKNAGVEPILQMTGRDRNRMAIMADVLSAASFGIDSVLALTGDHPVVGDCKDAKPVYDLDSVGILNMLSKMEQTNCDCGGNEIAGGAPATSSTRPRPPSLPARRVPRSTSSSPRTSQRRAAAARASAGARWGRCSTSAHPRTPRSARRTTRPSPPRPRGGALRRWRGSSGASCSGPTPAAPPRSRP